MQLKEVIRHEPDIRTYRDGEHIPASALVGIEVELENFRFKKECELTYWRAEHDGSLRDGGIEFVLRQPLTGHDLEVAIEELYSKVLTANYKVSPRTSTHVHIDARDLSVEHMKRLVFVYSMMERFIYDLVTPDREYSFYCTPLYRSSQNRRSIAKALDKLSFRSCPRYSGINLRALERYGSIEFRMHQGLTDTTDLKRWIKLLLKLRSGTKAFEDVPMEHILKMYSENSAQHIMEQVLGEELYRELVQDSYNDRLKESMRSAQDLLLLRKSGTLGRKENEWLANFRGQQPIEGIDPEVLEILRERREQILN